jgi:hypothetical protein
MIDSEVMVETGYWDAIAGLEPQHPEDEDYMIGYRSAA